MPLGHDFHLPYFLFLRLLVFKKQFLDYLEIFKNFIGQVMHIKPPLGGKKMVLVMKCGLSSARPQVHRPSVRKRNAELSRTEETVDPVGEILVVTSKLVHIV